MGDISDPKIDATVREMVDRETREEASKKRILTGLAGCRQALNGMNLSEAAVVVKNLAGDVAASNEHFLWKKWLDDTRQWIQTRRAQRNAGNWLERPSLILPPDRH